MSNQVVRVENISKAYRIGQRELYPTLGDVFSHLTTASWRRLRTPNHRPSSQKRTLSGRPANSHETYWALRNVSFDINKGEIVGIIGRNGACKSTLLKIMSRITKPTAGMVRLRGRIGSLLEVGTGFHPELTGRENIYLNGAVLGMHRTEIAAKFDEIVDFAEVDQFIDTPVKRYSSGMYLRLAFAVAAHLESEIMLVDEVLAVGDAVFQKKCLGQMEVIAGAGRTVVFVSHNVSAIQHLCPRSILLERGHLVAYADTASIVRRYLDTGVSEYPANTWIDVSQL